MKLLHKTLLVSTLLVIPFTAAQAHDSAAAHEAWIKAQKIDIEPTITVRETSVPADSGAASTSSSDHSVSPSTSGTSSSTNYTPGISTPSPSTSGGSTYTSPASSSPYPSTTAPGSSAPMGGASDTGQTNRR